jgi:hypothetical protein
MLMMMMMILMADFLGQPKMDWTLWERRKKTGSRGKEERTFWDEECEEEGENNSS